MRHSLFRWMQCAVLAGTLLGLCGCAGMMEIGPPPPGFLAPVVFDGPYDADIPPSDTEQIKKASLLMDWAVPYIFLRVATRFESSGDQVRSAHFFDRALAEFRKRKNAYGEGLAFGRKVSSLYHSGRTSEAYRAILLQEKKWPEAPLSAFVFYSYGFYHLQNGEYDRARDYFQRVLRIPWEDPDQPDILALRRDAEMGCGMALILADYFSSLAGRLCVRDFDEPFYRGIRRNIAEGVLHLKRAFALNETILHSRVYRYFPEITPLALECDLHNVLGLSSGMMGNVPEAEGHLEKAADMARKSRYRLGEADSIFFKSQVYLLDHNPDQGIRQARALEAIAGRYQWVSYSIWAKMILAHQYQALGDADRAIDPLNQALILMEDNGSWLPRDRDFRGIGGLGRPHAYEALLEMQSGKGDAAGSFRTAERSKAADMAEWLAQAAIGVKPAVSGLMERRQLYHLQLAEQYGKLFSPTLTDAALAQAVENFKQTRKDFGEEPGSMSQTSTADSLTSGMPPDVDELQRLLDRDTTLFTYYVGRDLLHIWAVSRRGFHQEKIKISREEVGRLVEEYLQAILSRDKGRANVLSERVYDLFLKKVIPFVAGDRLGIVPHGTLHDLPFASMRYVTSYLVDGFSLFYLPHAGMVRQALSQTETTETKRRFIFVETAPAGNPQPAVSAEVEVLKTLFSPTDFHSGNNASKSFLQNLIGFYDLMHFAADCALLEEAPLNSGLVLLSTRGGREWLDVRDIVRLQMKTRTTVLGGCGINSGKRLITGEAMPVMAGAWLYAASPSVVVSLWQVDDKSRAVWTEIFYKNLTQARRPAEVLRATQNEMIQRGYGPYEWAPFVLIGRY